MYIFRMTVSFVLFTENFADLKYLLGELGSPEVSRTIEDWDKGGRVYLDYITMMETLEQLQQVSVRPQSGFICWTLHVVV